MNYGLPPPLPSRPALRLSVFVVAGQQISVAAATADSRDESPPPPRRSPKRRQQLQNKKKSKLFHFPFVLVLTLTI